ncbi:hypothetical protein [Mycolicibacterium alvei]|nr:hypothetical protein [Mycolicibacterium alvei]MCV7001582.1 hypothetical protein [Mycolicibacterium alvei]
MFQPSAIQPTLEIVDFADSRHRAIVDYLAVSQSVTSRRRVGRRMGLLVWDDGQTGHRPLIGAAVLASARYSQRLRDRHLGWRTHYPKTSAHFDEDATSIREAGLARIMQLSIACAMRPYDVLSGAWLIAAAPFTEVGQRAFELACKKQDDPDLAAVVTTTGKGPSGFPFRNHRLGQLSRHRFSADTGANGNLYTHIHPASESDTLFASFEGLVSAKTVDLACALLQNERPDRFATAKDVRRYAVTYGLQRTGHTRRLFHGNEMGVHIGMLGGETRDHLTQGTSRRDRPRLDWDDVVKIWTGKFLPPSDGSDETATADTKNDHALARRKRLARAHKYPQEQVPLSFYITPAGG